MLRLWLLGLLLVWLLTTASSCQISVSNGSGTVAASGAAAGIGIALYLVGGAVLCVVQTEVCFPDEEALQARYETYVDAQARFTRGLRLYQAQDPEGLALICQSAHDGYSIAQYFYGSHLLRREGLLPRPNREQYRSPPRHPVTSDPPCRGVELS